MATVSSNRAAHAPAADAPLAWKRWNPGALHAEPQPARRAAESRPAAPDADEALRRRAHAAALEEAKRAGFQAGYAEGQKRALTEAAQVRAIAQAATEALQALGDTLAEKTVVLARAMAQKILQRELETCPESLIDIVREALTLLPDGAERIRIIVNSADVALLRGALPEVASTQDCAIIGSDDVRRGGCRITSPCGDIDATLDTRIERVLQALGAPEESPDGR